MLKYKPKKFDCIKTIIITSFIALSPSSHAAFKPIAYINHIGRVLSQGKPWLNARLRYLQVDPRQANLRQGYGTTLRVRLGYETPSFYNTRGILEFSHVTILGPEHFNSGGGTSPSKTRFAAIEDPDNTKVAQAYLQYDKLFDTQLRLGRRRINLDNQRFIGSVGFRQNEQSYDEFELTSHAPSPLTLYYAFFNRVIRVFGDEAQSPFDRFDSRSHAIRIIDPIGQQQKLLVYSYLIDNQNAPQTSNQSYGLRFTGQYPFNPQYHWLYILEYAYQTDGFDNPTDYSAHYYHIVGGIQSSRIKIKLGFEVLGGDDNQAFQTPYATLHRFNGWADVFTSTPNPGIRDFYLDAEKLWPRLFRVKTRMVLHHFRQQQNSNELGNEIDLQVSKRFGKYVSTNITYTNYSTQSSLVNSVQKWWLTLSFQTD